MLGWFYSLVSFRESTSLSLRAFQCSSHRIKVSQWADATSLPKQEDGIDMYVFDALKMLFNINVFPLIGF